MNALVHVPLEGEPRVDSRLVAAEMGVEHESSIRLINRHIAKFREHGILRFEIGEKKGRGQPARFVPLNEDQCYFLLSLSRNTKRVVELKNRLIHEFRAARDGVKRLTKAFLDERQAWQLADAESKEKGSVGARLMSQRRAEKRALRKQYDHLDGWLQRELFPRHQLAP